MSKTTAATPATTSTTDEVKPAAATIASAPAAHQVVATAPVPKAPPVEEPTKGGSFIRDPETGTLQRDPEQPALEGDRFRTKYLGAEPDAVRDASKKSAS